VTSSATTSERKFRSRTLPFQHLPDQRLVNVGLDLRLNADADPFSILLVRLEAGLAQWWYNHFHNVPPGFQLLGSGLSDRTGTPFSEPSGKSATLGDIFRLNPPASDAPGATFYDELPNGLTDNVHALAMELHYRSCAGGVGRESKH
jgi:hypothetical protein